MIRHFVPPLVAVLALGASACGVGAGEATDRALPPLTIGAPSTSSSVPTTTPTAPSCSDATSSYAPLSPLPSTDTAASNDSLMKSIVDRGRLVVAVDENTKGLATRDTSTTELEGVEIEIAKRIAERIFGHTGPDTIQFKTVTTKEKIDFPRLQKADLSISAISMTCERWQQVAFSSDYLTAAPTFLVRSESGITSRGGLAGKRVCVTQGSTSIGLMATVNDELERAGAKPAEVVPVEFRTDCLLELQEGMVDAYLGHDTFLTGMKEQNRRLSDFGAGGDELQHYGIAINRDHPYFVQYVNGVLQEMRDDGELQRLLDTVHKTVPDVPPTRPLP